MSCLGLELIKVFRYQTDIDIHSYTYAFMSLLFKPLQNILHNNSMNLLIVIICTLLKMLKCSITHEPWMIKDSASERQTLFLFFLFFDSSSDVL